MKGSENMFLTNALFSSEKKIYFKYTRKATKIKMVLFTVGKKMVSTFTPLTGEQTGQEVSISDFLSLIHSTTGYA
jgi:hypothetical protein